MRSQQQLLTLYKWVCEQSGHFWWEEWLPFVKPHVKDESWLESLCADESMIITQLKSIDPFGTGLISQQCFEILLCGLGFPKSHAASLLKVSGASSEASVRYEELFRWILQEPLTKPDSSDDKRPMYSV